MPDRLDAHRRMGEVVGDRRRRDDDGDGPVARHVAVVEPERRGDGPRREVVVHRHGVPVDGGRVQGRVPSPVDRDQPEHLAGSAVAVQVLVGVHADPVGGGHGAEGGAPFAERARDPLGPTASAVAVRHRGLRCLCRQHGEGGLPDGAEAEHVAAEPRGHRHGGGDDRAARPGQVAATVDPGRVDAQRLLDGADAALAHPAAAHPGIGRQAVDVVERQPGVGDRRQAGVDGQRERVDHQPPAEGGAADAAEDGPVLEALVAERRAGERPHRLRRPGRPGRPSPSARRAAATRPPAAGTGPRPPGRSRPRSGSQPTMFVVRWTRGSSAERDVGDDVGRIEVRQPAVGVDREADDRAAARHRGRLRRPAPAVRADGHRRMDQLAAVAAPLDAEGAVGARGPEPLVGRGQLGERPHRTPRARAAEPSIDIDVAIEHARHVTCRGRLCPRSPAARAQTPCSTSRTVDPDGRERRCSRLGRKIPAI